MQNFDELGLGIIVIFLIMIPAVLHGLYIRRFITPKLLTRNRDLLYLDSRLHRSATGLITWHMLFPQWKKPIEYLGNISYTQSEKRHYTINFFGICISVGLLAIYSCATSL